MQLASENTVKCPKLYRDHAVHWPAPAALYLTFAAKTA